ncbi:Potassium transporter KimA [Thermoflexales bacterium]|nr:Potassium transporter KimA [Thermoflexales bacterium]
MLDHLRHLLIGPPLPTQRLATERLNKVQALAAFSPDALSSIAYANQEIFLGLVVAGSIGLHYAWPIGLAITGLLGVLALSYYQTVHAYPGGGGSYTVARENLGALPGLIAAAALLIDYVLTAAVSLTAGVAAIASAFPALWPYRVEMALVLLVIITIANLRGLRETGTVMAIPVYFFLIAYLTMLAVGVVRAMGTGPVPLAATAPPSFVTLTPFLILHTFAAGCTALTGIEAISNGVPVFKRPESRNAGITLIVMAALMVVLFLGSIALTQYFAVVAGPQETILSALSRQVLGFGWPYLVVQIAMLLILAVAANTSFAGFPRLASILAQDGYLPHQFSRLGDRLVFSNGMIALAALTGLLIVAFNGDSHALIPLFAVGVFLAFTLSQAGMVVHWIKTRGRQWQAKVLINGLGTLTTTSTLLVVGISKFGEGAWIVALLIPLFMLMFQAIQRHYHEVARELTLRGLPPSLKPLVAPRVVLPISGVHRGVLQALRYAQSISDNVTAVYVETNPAATEEVRADWEAWVPAVPLIVVPSPYRSTLGPLLEFLEQTDREHHDGLHATVVLAEFIPARRWQYLLHNQTAWLLKLALIYQRRRFRYTRVIVDVPFYLQE